MAKKKDQERRSSAAYKRDLEKLFSGGGEAPERFKELLGGLAPEEGSEAAAWLEEVAALRAASEEGFRAFVGAVSAFHRAGHPWPDDEDLLTRMLDHPDERVLRAVLEHLHGVHERHTIARPRPILSRLSTIETMTDDPRTLTWVERLREALGA